MSEALAHNTQTSGNGACPVVIEDPEYYPFQPGERERDWHIATDEEYQSYLNYWNSKATPYEPDS